MKLALHELWGHSQESKGVGLLQFASAVASSLKLKAVFQRGDTLPPLFSTNPIFEWVTVVTW